MPVISATTQERLEGYFRLEWKLAAQRTHTMAEEKTFLLPVVIDSTRDADGKVPTEFRAVQRTKLPGGETPPAFVARVQKLLGGPSAPVATVAPVAPASAGLVPAARSGLPLWAGVALGVGVVALIGFLVMRPGAKDVGPAAKPVPETKPSPVAAPAAVPVVNEKSFAVLPFDNLSDDKENTAFFSDGMHEDILTALANIPELRVISRTSVLEYRDTTKKIPQIARELNVAYILEGSVRRAGNQIRLTGRLIRAANEEQVWSKSYPRDLTPKEMFAIQAALATEIAGALQAVISPATKQLVERRPTENLAAYDLYLQVRFLSPSKARAETREKLLQEAVDLDPSFAAAWAELAGNHAAFIFFDWENTPERLALADAAMARAVRLAPDAPEVMTMLGTYAWMGYRDYARAIVHFERVVRLQPNNVQALVSLGRTQRSGGRWLEALGNFRKACDLDAGSLFVMRDLLFSGRRWEEAIAVQRRIIALNDRMEERWRLAQFIFAATGSTQEIEVLAGQLTSAERDSPDFSPLQQSRAIIRGDLAEWKRLDALRANAGQAAALEAAPILAASGDLAGARARLRMFPAQLRSTLEREPANARTWARLALMEAILGEHEAAQRDARKALELNPESRDAYDGPRNRFNLAEVYAWSGNKEQAVAELSRLLRKPFSLGTNSIPTSVHTLRVDPAFANLRGDPAFEALLKDPKNHAPLF